jgi:protein-glutamine gamma-glutamyltransferase
MTLAARFRGFLLGAAVLSLSAFGAAEQSLGLAVLGVAGAVAGWWVTERGGGGGWKGLPRWVSTGVLLLMLLWAAAKSMQGQREVVSAFTGFLASIIVVKLWERRELRDYAQILTMSLFLTVGATLNNNSLVIGVLLAAQVPVMAVAVMLFQLHAAGEKVRESAWRGVAGGAERVAPWAAVSRAFARLALVTVLAGAGVSITVFVLVPRGIGLQEWGDFARPRGRQVTAFTEEVEPGAGEVISTSQVAMMEVAFQDQDGNPLGSLDRPFYLRGSVLDRYDAPHGKWTKATTLERVGFQIRPTDSWQELKLADVPGRGAVVLQRVTELAGVQGDTPVFALYMPVSLRLNHVEQAQDITFDAVTGWVVRRGDGLRVTYDITSVVDPPGPEGADRSGRVSFPSPTIHELAADLLRRSGYDPDPARRPLDQDGRASRVFETYLRNNYEYTLSPGGVPSGQSPTEYFLFTLKRGHCEYFASALAAMCRSVGIEARVVAGYLANEYHQDRGAYVVRASDAHAWVEVNTGPGGWQRRDATPADTLRDLQNARGSLWARLQRLGAAVQDMWNSAVVTFDQTTQERLLGRVGDQPDRGLLDRGVNAVRRSMGHRFDDARPDAWAARIMLAGALFLTTGLVWAGWRAVARRNLRGAPGDGVAMSGGQLRVHRELLATLARRGYPKPRWLPPRTHLRTVAAADPVFAGAAGEVVDLLYRACFGGGGGGDLDAARDRLRALRRGPNANGKR